MADLTNPDKGKIPEGPLTNGLKKFMVQMWKESGHRLNPSHLFSEICKR